MQAKSVNRFIHPSKWIVLSKSFFYWHCCVLALRFIVRLAVVVVISLALQILMYHPVLTLGVKNISIMGTSFRYLSPKHIPSLFAAFKDSQHTSPMTLNILHYNEVCNLLGVDHWCSFSSPSFKE